MPFLAKVFSLEKMDPLEGCSSKYTRIGEQELEMDWCLSEAGGEDEESLF